MFTISISKFPFETPCIFMGGRFQLLEAGCRKKERNFEKSFSLTPAFGFFLFEQGVLKVEGQDFPVKAGFGFQFWRA